MNQTIRSPPVTARPAYVPTRVTLQNYSARDGPATLGVTSAAKQLVSEPGVARIVAEPDAEIRLGDVRALDDPKPTAVQGQLRSDSRNGREGVAVGRFDVAVPTRRSVRDAGAAP